MKNAFIIGEKIYLRSLTPEDAEGSYPDWLNDPKVCKYNSHYRFPYNKEKALDYIQYSMHTQNALILAVVDKANDRHIGNICLQEIDQINRNAEFAIIIGDKDYWGNGFAYEAAKLLISHGFKKLNLHRIYCGTPEKNTAMQKLSQNLGMQQEGRRREAIFTEGCPEDLVEYGLLRNEFFKK